MLEKRDTDTMEYQAVKLNAELTQNVWMTNLLDQSSHAPCCVGNKFLYCWIISSPLSPSPKMLDDLQKLYFVLSQTQVTKFLFYLFIVLKEHLDKIYRNVELR